MIPRGTKRCPLLISQFQRLVLQKDTEHSICRLQPFHYLGLLLASGLTSLVKRVASSCERITRLPGALCGGRNICGDVIKLQAVNRLLQACHG